MSIFDKSPDGTNSDNIRPEAVRRTGKSSFKEKIGKVSPRAMVVEALEHEKMLENAVGFMSVGDGTDVSVHIANLGVHIAGSGYSVCILDLKTLFPNIYKILGADFNKAETGLLRVLRLDKADIRSEVVSTKYKNLYVLSPSPEDMPGMYFDIPVSSVARVIAELKDRFDIVLIDIPVEIDSFITHAALMESNIGFVFWSER